MVVVGRVGFFMGTPRPTPVTGVIRAHACVIQACWASGTGNAQTHLFNHKQQSCKLAKAFAGLVT